MATKSKPVTIVGPREAIDFPDLGLIGVPAKIDTGADNSAIWASNIEEKDGVLHYVLFDRLSPFYTGKVLTARKFGVASIKNSFGQTEFRYKVALKIRLMERTIRVTFTLANREHNSQPILIGSRTLHGKFLVDVSADRQADLPSRLLLMTRTMSPEVSAFARGVEAVADNLAITHTTYDDVQFTFGPQGTHVTLRSTGEDVASFNMVHFKTSGERDVAAAMGRYLQRRGVKVVDESALHFAPSSKLYEYAILADNGIQIPTSLFLPPSQMPGAYQTFVEQLGLPFVLKDIHAKQGAHNYLIHDETEYSQACERLQADSALAIGQKFVPNTGDYRVLVFGRRIALVIHRSRPDDSTHLNNTSQGGSARLVDASELPGAVQTACILGAKVMDYGVAGVDMVQDSETGVWYCFEVNNGPQLVTGAFLHEKQVAFAKYIETELSK